MVTVGITNLDLEGAVLELPRDYVLSRSFQNGQVREALLLRADVYDFSSYPKAKGYLEDGRSKITAGVRDWVQVLISAHRPMWEMAAFSLVGKYEGFTHTNATKRVINLKPTAYGLMEAHGYTEKGFSSNSDIFFQKDDHAFTDIIQCDKSGEVPYPNCVHIFEAGAYDVKISYGRKELSRWQDIRNGVTKLLQCFTIKEPVELPDLVRVEE